MREPVPDLTREPVPAPPLAMTPPTMELPLPAKVSERAAALFVRLIAPKVVVPVLARFGVAWARVLFVMLPGRARLAVPVMGLWAAGRGVWGRAGAAPPPCPAPPLKIT